MKHDGRTISQQADHETLANVVEDLRLLVDETQAVFARRFHKSRTYITNTERGDLHSELFVHDLVGQFPHMKKRILAAYQCSLNQGKTKSSRQQESSLQRQVNAYIRAGRFTDAQSTLLDARVDVTEDGVGYWIYEQLHVVYLALGKEDDAVVALNSAIHYAVHGRLKNDEILSRERLADLHQRSDYIWDAHRVLDAGLQRLPDAGLLWLRKGKVHWHEEQYSQTYAALTTALKYGASRNAVLLVRGQALAEWRSFDAALSDLNDYLSTPAGTSADIASARSARAYVWGHRGEWDRALTEFGDSERLHRESAWLHYRQGLFHVEMMEDKASAIYHLRRALEYDNPTLNSRRKNHATMLLEKYGVLVPDID